MNFNTYIDDMLAVRDIRLYPTEIDRVSTRGAQQMPEAERGSAFSEVAAAVNRASSAEAAPSEPTVQNGKSFSMWEKESFGFADFIDIINPLHHIPIVATLYRNLSGDQIGAAPRVIGGAVWGRLGGFVSGIVNAVVEWWSGKDIGDHIYAAIFGPPKNEPQDNMFAEKKSSPPGLSKSAMNEADAPEPQDGHGIITTTIGTQPAASSSGDSENPTAWNSPLVPILAPATRAALSSYEKNLDWNESDEPFRVRYPA